MNRELSFLSFNDRIVEEAADPEVPLLERLKFLSIVSSNLDEFFMIRVAGLKQQMKSGVLETGPDGALPREQLQAIAKRVAAQVDRQESIYLEQVAPGLAEEGIHLLEAPKVADPEMLATLEAAFEEDIFPMLTPMAVDPGHPFPFLKNRSLNLAVHLLPDYEPNEAAPLLAVVQVPDMLPRFFTVPTDETIAVVLVEDVIKSFVGRLFVGMRILECVPFRVVRNWDLQVDEDEQEDLLDAVQAELRRRWRLDAVVLEINHAASEDVIDALRSSLKLGRDDVHRHRAPLALTDFAELIAEAGRPDLRDPPFQPVLRADLKRADDLFAEIARRDILLHHPYESYEPVVDLVERAARDPNVLAIKQALYRTNRDSPIVAALATAAENGKQVTALLELKARFDEQTNIEWARELEEAGVHVFYGMIGLKTHCKLTMVVRREHEGMRRYVHLGTGNYNEETATIYSDLSFFTAREDITADVAALFNLLTGYSDPPRWRKLVVAPLDLRHRLVGDIRRAAAAAADGAAAKIVLKSNALVDASVIRELCKAAAAGVDVTCLVRGPCALRVGVPGASDQVKVRMTIDRFLEHSRIFWFSVDGVDDVFITSTDVMPRNFDRRVEVMVPIEDPGLKRRIIEEILGLELADTAKAAELLPTGAYARVSPEGAPAMRAQEAFVHLARRRAADEEDKTGTPRSRQAPSTP